MNQPLQMNVSLDQTSEISCDNCGHKYFSQGVYLRKASKLLTGTPQDAYIPIPVFSCMSCNHVNAEFLPKEVQSLDK